VISQSARYAISCAVHLSYEAADRLVREELLREGFGVLTEIDVRATLKVKLSVEMPPYEILGACNPPLAYKAVRAEPDVGLLLPCNIVVRSLPEDGTTVVEALDPVVQLEITDNPQLKELASAVRTRLVRVIERVAASG
jgi:uncharacterized protein (DUF302 family)